MDATFAEPWSTSQGEIQIAPSEKVPDRRPHRVFYLGQIPWRPTVAGVTHTYIMIKCESVNIAIYLAF